MKTTFNAITFWMFVGFWPVWLVWELVLLALRGASPGDMPGLISMVARDRGWSLTVVVYLWTGLAAHFWINTDAHYSKPWESLTAITFWLIAVALLVWDITLWRTNFHQWSPALRWVRWPVAWMIAGALSGRFLFPQVGLVPWR